MIRNFERILFLVPGCPRIVSISSWTVRISSSVTWSFLLPTKKTGALLCSSPPPSFFPACIIMLFNQNKRKVLARNFRWFTASFNSSSHFFVWSCLIQLPSCFTAAPSHSTLGSSFSNEHVAHTAWPSWNDTHCFFLQHMEPQRKQCLYWENSISNLKRCVQRGPSPFFFSYTVHRFCPFLLKRDSGACRFPDGHRARFRTAFRRSVGVAPSKKSVILKTST